MPANISVYTIVRSVSCVSDAIDKVNEFNSGSNTSDMRGGLYVVCVEVCEIVKAV